MRFFTLTILLLLPFELFSQEFRSQTVIRLSSKKSTDIIFPVEVSRFTPGFDPDGFAIIVNCRVIHIQPLIEFLDERNMTVELSDGSLCKLNIVDCEEDPMDYYVVCDAEIFQLNKRKADAAVGSADSLVFLRSHLSRCSRCRARILSLVRRNNLYTLYFSFDYSRHFLSGFTASVFEYHSSYLSKPRVVCSCPFSGARHDGLYQVGFELSAQQTGKRFSLVLSFSGSSSKVIIPFDV